jgi:hypothetical protein
MKNMSTIVVRNCPQFRSAKICGYLRHLRSISENHSAY